MLYAARKLLEQQCTVAAFNAARATVDAALAVSTTALAAVVNGQVDAPQDAASFPALVIEVGTGAGAGGEMLFQGKRDYRVPVRLTYVSRHATLATGLTDVEVAVEVLADLLETVVGLQWAATGRRCVEVLDPTAEYVKYQVGGEAVRVGGELRCTLLMRREG